MEKYLKNVDNMRLMANVLMILGILSTSIAFIASLMVSGYLNTLFSLIPLIVSFILYSLLNVIADISENIYEIRQQKERENNR
jgi:hypothetical protein|nr:MAG TPA: hypothetical protein [Caudoviricetes sp.]